MSCEFLTDENGKVTGFVCSRGKIKNQKCYICGKPAAVLCDAPKNGGLFGEACNKPMCREHAHHIGLDNDVCDLHFNKVSIRKAKENRKNLEKWGWEISTNYICPVCHNEEFNEDARFCRICGAKIEKGGKSR